MEVLRSGQPGKDAGLAAAGHGWPMAAGPRSRTGAKAWRALASHRTSGARAFGYLALFQVTRCKSGTNRSHHPKNGYVHLQNPSRLTRRLREQARLLQLDQRPWRIRWPTNQLPTLTAAPAQPAWAPHHQTDSTAHAVHAPAPAADRRARHPDQPLAPMRPVYRELQQARPAPE